MPDDPEQYNDEWAILALSQTRRIASFAGDAQSRFAGDGLAHMLQEKVWHNCFRWSGEAHGVLGNTTRLVRSIFTARDRDRTGRLSPILFEACLKQIPGTHELSTAHMSKLRENYRVYDEYNREKMYCDYERFIHDMAFGRLTRSEQLAHAASDLRQCIRDKIGRASNLSRAHEASKLGKRLCEVIEGPRKPSTPSAASKRGDADDNTALPPLTGLVARRKIEQNCGIILQEHTMFHIGADYVEKQNRKWSMDQEMDRDVLMDFVDDYALDLLDPTWNEGLVTDIVLREWSARDERELDEAGYTVVPVDFSRFAMASKPGTHAGMTKPVFMFVQRKSRADIDLDPRAIVTDIALIANPTAEEWKSFGPEGGMGWWPKNDHHGIFLFLKRGAVPTGGPNAPSAVSDILIVVEDADGLMSQSGVEAGVRPSGLHHPAKRFDIPCCRLWLLQPHQRVAFDPLVKGVSAAANSGGGDAIVGRQMGRVVTSAALQHAVETIRKNKDIANDLKHPSRWSRVVDTNRDGRVSHDEIARALEFEYEVPMKALSYDEKKALFSAIDADANGTITMQEMTRFLGSYKMPVVHYALHDQPHGENEAHSGAGAQRALSVGVQVQAHYRADGVWHSQFYPGAVSRVHPDGSCDIKYDDGDVAHNVPLARVRFRDGSAPGPASGTARGDARGGSQRHGAGVLRIRILSATGLEGDDRYSWGIAASAAWHNPYGLVKVVHTRGGEGDSKFVKTSTAMRTAANGERGGSAEWDTHKTYNRVTRLRVWPAGPGGEPELHLQLRRAPVAEGRSSEEIGTGVLALGDVLSTVGSSVKRTLDLGHGRGSVALELLFVALAVPNSRDPRAPATKTPHSEMKADDDTGGTLYASIVGLKGLSPAMLSDGLHSSRPYIEFKLPWARSSGKRAKANTLPLEPSQSLLAITTASTAEKYKYSRLELQVIEGVSLPSREDGGRPTPFVQMFVMTADQHLEFTNGLSSESDAAYLDTIGGPKHSRTGPAGEKWFTDQIRSTCSPQWNEEFTFPSNPSDYIVLVVRDMLEPRNAMDHTSQAPVAYVDLSIADFLSVSGRDSMANTSQPRWLDLKPFGSSDVAPISGKLQVELVVADTLQYEASDYQSQQLLRFESSDVLEGVRGALNRMVDATASGGMSTATGGLGLTVSLMHKTAWGEPSVLAVGNVDFQPTSSGGVAKTRSANGTLTAWTTLHLPSRGRRGASASAEVACQAQVELRFEPAHASTSNVERVKVGVELLDAKGIAYVSPAKNGAPPNPYVVGVRANGEEIFRSDTKTALTNAAFNEFLGHFNVASPQDTLDLNIMHAIRGHASSWFSQTQSVPDELIGSARVNIGKKVWTSREGDVENIDLVMQPSRDQHMLSGAARSAGTVRIKLSTLEVGRAGGGVGAQSCASIIDPFAKPLPVPHLASQSPQMRLQAAMHVKEMVLAAQGRGQSAARMFIEKDPLNSGAVPLDVFHSVIATLLHMGAMSTGERARSGGSTFDGFHAELQLVEEECRLESGSIDYGRFTAMLTSSNVQELLRAPGASRPTVPFSNTGGFISDAPFAASLTSGAINSGIQSRALTLGNPTYMGGRANPLGIGASGLEWLQGPRVLSRLWNDFERSDGDGLGHASRETFSRIVRNVSRTLGGQGEIPEHMLQVLAAQHAPISVEAAARHGRDCVNYEAMLTAIESGSALTSSRTPGATYATGVFDGMVRDAIEKTRKWAIRSFSGSAELKATMLVNGTRFGDTFAGGNAASSSFITRIIPRALFRRRLSSLGLVLDSSEWVSMLNSFNADGVGAVGVNVDSFLAALNLDGAFVAEGGGWQSSKLIGAPGAAAGGVRALRWRVLESIFMRGAHGLDKVKDLLEHEDSHGRGRGDMLQNDGIIGRSSFRKAIRRIVQGRVSRDVRLALSACSETSAQRI